MKKFLASIDRKRVMINIIGYFVVILLFFASPMEGFMGQAITIYVWLFPIYFGISLALVYWRNRERD